MSESEQQTQTASQFAARMFLFFSLERRTSNNKGVENQRKTESCTGTNGRKKSAAEARAEKNDDGGESRNGREAEEETA